jgi:C-terminal processing protease CtpA/Prc
MIKYTVENWLTPDGNWIDKEGIEPTDLVEFDGVTYYENPIAENDNQLQKALELVSQ